MNNYYKSIASEQLTDYEPFYWEVAKTLPNEAKIVEVGIADGRGIIMMASIMKELGKMCQIWGIDNFYYGHENQKNCVTSNIIKSGETSITLIESTSLDASCRFNDEYIDLCFIDSSHVYEQTKAELRLWIHKVKFGGILAGHDYNIPNEENPEPDNGIIHAINEIVPKEFFKVHDTNFHLGVWEIKRTADFKFLK